MRPNADLAILNFLQREIVKRGVMNREFVEKHCIFSTGVTDIGYGLRNTDKYARPAEKTRSPSSSSLSSTNTRPSAKAASLAKALRKEIQAPQQAIIGA